MVRDRSGKVSWEEFWDGERMQVKHIEPAGGGPAPRLAKRTSATGMVRPPGARGSAASQVTSAPTGLAPERGRLC